MKRFTVLQAILMLFALGLVMIAASIHIGSVPFWWVHDITLYSAGFVIRSAFTIPECGGRR